MADDMLGAAKDCERIGEDIHDSGTRPLAANWSGSAYGMANKVLTDSARDTEVLSILARSSVDPLDTLSHAVSIAQAELHTGIGIATGAGLSITESSGQVNLPATMPEDHTAAQAMRDAQRVSQQVINDSVEAASQADALCATALSRTDRTSPTTSVDRAEAVQTANESDALREIRDTLPDGLPPSEVATWWNALTPKEQQDLQRACPVELCDLNGIPKSVKEQIDRPGRGYSSVGTVRYAQKNWNNRWLDEYDDNCANFVSDSLAYGGRMKQKENSGLLRHGDQDDWSDATDGTKDVFTTWATHIPWGVGHNAAGLYHTPTWGGAQNNHDFFMKNGGREVAPEDARPGDIVYFQSDRAMPSDGIRAGEIHHAAVVTGVLPDGQVLYTQHSDSATNYPLAGRLPVLTQNEGPQTIKIVTPRATW